MPGRLSPSRCVLLIWALIFLATVPLVHLPVSRAGDEIATDNGEMAKQREAYQSQHNLIKAVQKRLDEYGYRPGPIDGIFGQKTRTALMAFQRDHQLMADGIIGIETLRVLHLIRTMP